MFDNISRFLIEQYSPDFASWLIGEPVVLTELSPSELSLEPIRADALILLQAAEVILHCEFQTAPDATMPFRMADYALRVFRRFPQKRLVQVVVYLRPTDSELVQQTRFNANRLSHEFEVVRLWEQPTEIFLQRPGLLPYAVLSQTSDRAAVLRNVAAVIEELPDPRQQSNLAAASGILAGLVLDQQLIQRLLRRDLMQESVIYQELRAEAQAEARAEAQAELRRELEESRNQARRELEESRSQLYQELEMARAAERRAGEQSLILRLLTRKLGEMPNETRTQIEALGLAELEELAETLLSFTSLTDLSDWLEQLPQ